MIEGIVIACVSFVLFLITHFLLFHYRKIENRWGAVSRLAAAFLLLYIASFWIMPFNNWFGVLNTERNISRLFAFFNGAVIYFFLFITYGQIYFLIDRGVSARILIEIEESENKMLGGQDIEKKYNPNMLQNRRLADMLYGKYLVKENGYYIMTAKGRIMAKCFLFAKKYLKLYPGG